MSYTPHQIAEILGTSMQNIYYYIKKGYLIAEFKDGSYTIKNTDYNSFREEYFHSDSRNSNRGISKKLTDIQINLLSSIIEDIKNKDISYKNFIKKYETKEKLIPQIKEFIMYKRDTCIKFDNFEKGFRYKKLAIDYNLSVRSIEDIVNQNKKRSDF